MVEQEKVIPVVAVVGPTASGKTALSVELALRLNGEIVSADSMQIYTGMDIGTAKPDAEEMRGVPHHMIDFVPIDREYSVADYVEEARKAVFDINARGKTPIVVGGTGLYVDSLLNNIQFGVEESDPELRAELRKFADEHGPEALHDILRKIDPELAAKLHLNNIGRIVRAIEVYRLTGVPMSERQRMSRCGPKLYDVFWIGLNFRDRKKLYDRIDRRVDIMMAGGLMDEVRRLHGAELSATASQAIGYKELFEYAEGRQELGEAVEQLKRSTRRYAKRQLTWFKRNININWVYMDDTGVYNKDVLSYLEEQMKKQDFVPAGKGMT